MTSHRYDVITRDSAAELDKRLSDELDRVNAEATMGLTPQRELTVEIRMDDQLVAGLSGWTWENR